MTTIEARREAARKAHETRRARKAAAQAAALGPIPQVPGLHAFVCPSCKTAAHVISATAEVWHRCPSAGLKTVTFVAAATGPAA